MDAVNFHLDARSSAYISPFSLACSHGTVWSICRICKPCTHGLKKWVCTECGVCRHRKTVHSCTTCKICPHGLFLVNCVRCKGCCHNIPKQRCFACRKCFHGKISGCEICTHPLNSTKCSHGVKKRCCRTCIYDPLKDPSSFSAVVSSSNTFLSALISNISVNSEVLAVGFSDSAVQMVSVIQKNAASLSHGSGGIAMSTVQEVLSSGELHVPSAVQNGVYYGHGCGEVDSRRFFTNDGVDSDFLCTYLPIPTLPAVDSVLCTASILNTIPVGFELLRPGIQLNIISCCWFYV